MERLNGFAPAVLRQLLRQGPMSQQKLECAWEAAVGRAISRVTTVRLRCDGIVEVAVRSEAWRRELERALPEMTARLQSLAGRDVVKGLRVAAIGPGGTA